MTPQPPLTVYDPTLFQGNAPYYARYVTYPEGLFRLLERECALDGRGRLLDLGCGTGQLTIPLAPLFEEAIGLDLEPEMVQEAERVAREAGIGNIQWVRGAAEDLDASWGSFRLVTIGVAFHWMDRVKVLDLLYDRLDEDGAVAIIYHAGRETTWSGPNPWPVIDPIVRRYIGESRRGFPAGGGHDHRNILPDSRFGLQRIDDFSVSYERDWTIEGLIGFVYTKSYQARFRFGDRADAFEQEVRQSLSSLEATGQFRGQGEIRVLRIRREPSRA